MFDLLLFHRRSRRTGRGAFRDHWLHRRAPLVEKLKQDLGYGSYVQIHRASRLDILYLGILASRSWPVAALFSVAQGLPLPPLLRGANAARERWDAVEIFSYSSPEALGTALTSPAGRAAAVRLGADALGLTAHATSTVGRNMTVYAEPGLGWPRTVTLFCLRARPPMTRSQMLERWKTEHSDLVQSLRPALRFRAYDQIHAMEPENLADVLTAMGAPPTTFDGVASLAYGSRGEMLSRLLSPSMQIANLRLARDEVNFIDGRNSALVFGEATMIADGDKSS